jgi:ribosomal protein S18 acetylase RimI-like enzyme
MVDIRQAGVDDAAALHQLAAETFPLACPPGTAQHSIDAHIAANLSEKRFAEYLADPSRKIFIAGDFAGYTMLVFGEPTDPDVAAALTTRPTVELSKCYARAAEHGSGLATQLIAHSISAARESGAAAMWLGVSQVNARANRFYEKNGFVTVGEKTFMVAEELNHDFIREQIL